jgi:hypothetical protein
VVETSKFALSISHGDIDKAFEKDPHRFVRELKANDSIILDWLDGL